MRADLRQLALAGLAAAALALPAGCGDDEDPLRVGVLVECTGILKAFDDATFAGAELPIKQRDGSAGGRRVEVVKGCVEIGSTTPLITETRRLIEDEGVDVVVGPVGETEGVLMTRIAARYPDVTFLLGASAAQETTLRHAQPNVFRFSADAAQAAAGLASYAYHDLGWRRAAVAFDYPASSWASTAGFVAEFCSLGGTVDSQGAFIATRADRALAKRLAREADGVFLTDGFYSAAEFLRSYGDQVKRLPARLVLNGYWLSQPRQLAPKGVDLAGVVVGGDIPFDSERPEWRRYLRSYAAAFPDLPKDSGGDLLVVPYYLSMEALARALNAVDGKIGPRGKTLRSALARVRFAGPTGPIRLDANRQAIVSVHLRRVSPQGDKVTTRPFRVIRQVDESYGGRFTPRTPVPSPFALDCRHGDPPPWARG
jgi:branched-chain amino acid transport system substrate-binding protein